MGEDERYFMISWPIYHMIDQCPHIEWMYAKEVFIEFRLCTQKECDYENSLPSALCIQKRDL